MPKAKEFNFQILVGGTPVVEYVKDGNHFVECNLHTPVSYLCRSTDVVNGEEETQSWPVTPYEIIVTASPKIRHTYYYRIFVDGTKLKGVSLKPGESRIIRGFRDGSVIRELLFSMPRFAQSEDDRLCEGRVSRVGMVEVECWCAVLQSSSWKVRRKQLDFVQANKKDSFTVTKGEFTMTTSRAGKVLTPRSEYRCVDQWRRTTLQCRLSVLYRMGTELQDLGFKLKPFVMNPPAFSSDSDDAEDNNAEDSDAAASSPAKKTRLSAERKSSAREDRSKVRKNAAKLTAGEKEDVKPKLEEEPSTSGAGRGVVMETIELSSEDEDEVQFVGRSGLRRVGAGEILDVDDDDDVENGTEAVAGTSKGKTGGSAKSMSKAGAMSAAGDGVTVSGEGGGCSSGADMNGQHSVSVGGGGDAADMSMDDCAGVSGDGSTNTNAEGVTGASLSVQAPAAEPVAAGVSEDEIGVQTGAGGAEGRMGLETVASSCAQLSDEVTEQ